MKVIYKILSIGLFCFVVSINKTSAQQNFVSDYANKVANRMKDTLGLTDSQRAQVYTISKQLGEQKQAAWTQYAGNETLINQKIQEIENTRDGLYRSVIGEDKYVLYRQKKSRLLNNN